MKTELEGSEPGFDRAGYYRGLLAEQKESGQSLKSFAASRGVSAWTLYGWRRRLGLGGKGKRRRGSKRAEAKGSLLAVKVLGGVPIGEQYSFEVLVRGERRIRVRGGFDADELGRLIALIEKC